MNTNMHETLSFSKLFLMFIVVLKVGGNEKLFYFVVHKHLKILNK